MLLVVSAVVIATAAACPAGHFQTPDNACEPCPVGSKGSFFNARSCTACRRNFYQNSAGQVSCKHCPQGYTQPLVGKAYCSHPHHILQSTSHTLTMAIEAYTAQEDTPAFDPSAEECSQGMNRGETVCKCTACDIIQTFMIKSGQHCSEHGLYFEPVIHGVPHIYGYVMVEDECEICGKCIQKCARWTGILRENFTDPVLTNSSVEFVHTTDVCDLLSHNVPLRSNKCI